MTVVHHHDLVGEAFGLEQEVRAHQDGLAAFGHLVDEAEHGAGRLRVEARGRLVEQQEIGLVQHRARQREPGAHAGGVAADLLVERVGDPEALRGLGDPGVDQPRFHPEQRGRVLEVVGARQPVVQRGAGGHDTAPAPHLGAFGLDLGVEPERAHRAAVGMQRAGDQPHDRRLAGTVRAEQHRHRAARDLEGEVVDREHLAEGAANARERDGRSRIPEP